LERVTDALGNETSLTYDGLNNLTQVTNARNHSTAYAYGHADLPTFRTHMTDTLGYVTVYTPTLEATDGISGLLKAQRDPKGLLTTYDYNEYGQVKEVVRAAGTSDALTTAYGYDTLGRLITTTQGSPAESHTSLNVYDDADRLIASIANWTGSNPANWQQDCIVTGGSRDSNICTRYGYDGAGRTISTTNPLGQTSRTFYDDAGRVVTQVVNYDGTTDPSQLCTSFADPDPEYNICSLTGYDSYGRVVTSTDSLGIQSVTEYDALGRVSRSINNYVNGVYSSGSPDEDIITEYEYDAAGNTLIVTDTLGQMSRTFYDELNRVVGTIDNWSGAVWTYRSAGTKIFAPSSPTTKWAIPHSSPTPWAA
jgi:YD repeat-containing protein